MDKVNNGAQEEAMEELSDFSKINERLGVN